MSKKNGHLEFENPLAVIQAAVDLLSKDPDNKAKLKLVCKIISEQAKILGEGLTEHLEGECSLEV